MALNDITGVNDTNSTKAKLASLKAQLIADPLNFNAQSYIADTTDFPPSQQIKLIDYVGVKKVEYKELATKVINNIILNYVKDDKLLTSPRLADVRDLHILKLAETYLLVGMSENNMILLQEVIDGGDLGKDIFQLIHQAQTKNLENINARDEHIEKCEKYWENYSSIYGLENQEEKIIMATEEKNEDKDKKLTITTHSDLNNAIQYRLEQLKKEKDEQEKK